MLNLFQHLVVSMGYETLKQVQGDIPVIYTQTLISEAVNHGGLVTEQGSTVDLTTGNIWENIWRMSWPMLIVMFFNFLVGLTDVYVAGFLGPEIQAIVGFVSQLYFSSLLWQTP